MPTLEDTEEPLSGTPWAEGLEGYLDSALYIDPATPPADYRAEDIWGDYQSEDDVKTLLAKLGPAEEAKLKTMFFEIAKQLGCGD